jgi:hypothetical protein
MREIDIRRGVSPVATALFDNDAYTINLLWHSQGEQPQRNRGAGRHAVTPAGSANFGASILESKQLPRTLRVSAYSPRIAKTITSRPRVRNWGSGLTKRATQR